ncbi:MAG: DUF4013 domain-containing protein, partial [Methanobacteriaceae archaeon]|nr:DUF4013 domain-containing protein [Methanobacteriaceae archaeon]
LSTFVPALIGTPESYLPLEIIFTIISIIVALITGGYAISLIKNSINLSDELPCISLANNIVDGVKLLVVALVYIIIFAIILFVVGYATGGLEAIQIAQAGIINTAGAVDANAIISAIPTKDLLGLGATAAIGLILAIIFGIFLNISECRLAKNDSITDAINLGNVFDDINEIGWLRYIGWYIILIIIAFIIGIISSAILNFTVGANIGFLGIIINNLIFVSFLQILTARSLGLLYSDVA